MTERIQTLHPEGKQGVNIDKAKYEAMKAAIVTTLAEHGELTFKALNAEVGRQLAGNFEGSIGWYFTTVKLDLETRGLVERVGKSPQRIKLVSNDSK